MIFFSISCLSSEPVTGARIGVVSNRGVPFSVFKEHSGSTPEGTEARRSSCEEAFDAIVKCGRDWSPSQNRTFQPSMQDKTTCHEAENLDNKVALSSSPNAFSVANKTSPLHVNVTPVMGLSMPLLTSPVSVRTT